jgi:hypothetical protein
MIYVPAIRGTVSRAELRQIIAATYHQVWWPPTDDVRFDGDRMPVWHEALEVFAANVTRLRELVEKISRTCLPGVTNLPGRPGRDQAPVRAARPTLLPTFEGTPPDVLRRPAPARITISEAAVPGGVV